MRTNIAMLCAASASLLLSSCGADPSSQLVQRREQAEFAQLAQVKTLLSTKGALDTDFQVFLSKGALDQVLKQIGTVEVPLPELDDAALTIADARTAFSNGYPAVDLKVTLTSRKRNINAKAAVSALLFLDAAPNAISNGTFRIVLRDIAPEVSVGFFEFSVKGFWKDLAALVAQEKIANLPSFSLPLYAQSSFAFGGASTLILPTGNGSTLTGVLTVPAVSGIASVSLKHVLFLEDGAHLYLVGEAQ